jgi:hypothetical protein
VELQLGVEIASFAVAEEISEDTGAGISEKA